MNSVSIRPFLVAIMKPSVLKQRQLWHPAYYLKVRDSPTPHNSSVETAEGRGGGSAPEHLRIHCYCLLLLWLEGIKMNSVSVNSAWFSYVLQSLWPQEL